MSEYLNDPREMSIRPESGITLEEDNRIEKMYHWGAKVLDLCDLPVEEYMRPMTVIIDEGGGGVSPEPEPEPEQHEYVDLGLSVKWATCNIGANTPEEAGLYFAWGETSGYTAEQVGNEGGKRAFKWGDYKFGEYNTGDTQDYGMTKYNKTDGKKILDANDDAATVNWGEGWRMPTEEEFWELLALPHTWDFSKNGYSFTDDNGNELLFLFAGGYANSGRVDSLGNYGFYWSSSVDGGSGAWGLPFDNAFGEVGGGDRCYGCSVRPVRK